MLASLYEEVPDTPSPSNPITESWIRFLEGTGNSPIGNKTEIRAIHLLLQNVDSTELEKAVTAFFDESMQLVYISTDQAAIIEKKSTYTQTTEDFASFVSALEADFFMKAKLYVGKFHLADESYHKKFAKEAEWFLQGTSLLPKERIFTMELLFPSFFIRQASQEMNEILHREILEPIGYDDSMLETVRSFFENGFNASVTSEKLHIHRNTLNYRLAKFQETTGISVRSFDGALVAYCASLLASR
jgi:DNA-binding PucR family transcriptional regulator